MADVLRSEVDGAVAILTLNRPARRNALDWSLASALVEKLDEIGADEKVRCVILTGAGGHFSVGGDLADGAGGVTGDQSPGDLAGSLRAMMRSAELLHEMPKPTIAAIHGACAGAGLALACAADLRYAADTARFSTAFAQAGVSGDYGGTWTLPRILGHGRARELYLLAEKFGADTAERLGLVSAVWPERMLIDQVTAIAHRLAGMAPLALAAIKANLNDSPSGSLSLQLDREAERHIATARTADAAEAAAAFLEKRSPHFRGH